MYLKKINTVFFCLPILFAQLFSGCVSIKRYPSAWPDKQPVKSLSQLSGVYNPEVSALLADYIEHPYSSPGPYGIRLLFNDSFQYEIRSANSAAISNAGDMIMEHPQNLEKKYVKKSFSKKKGLQLSYHPDIGGQGTPLGVLRNYIFLNKDKEGNLIIKRGQRCFGLVWLFFPVIGNRYEWISVRKNSITYSSFRLKPIYPE